ncbi:MAG: hypothetical protein IPN15_07715 [Saprospiraceae bacterium]|nr:hypothetical protein [Candidatus Vicinibacter affinis]
MQKFLIILFALALNYVEAQSIYFVRSVFENDLGEWSLRDSVDEELGFLRIRFMNQDKLAGWDCRILEESGTIRLRWADKPDEWTLQMGGKTFMATPVWPGQYDQWRITDNQEAFTLFAKFDVEGVDWRLVDGSNNSVVSIYNEYINDKRDWVLEYDPDKITNSFVVLSFFIIVRYL